MRNWQRAFKEFKCALAAIVMPLRNLLIIAFAGLVFGVGFAAPAGANPVVFTDPGTFSTTIWSKTILAAGDVVDTRETSGGNPGAFLQVQTIPNDPSNPNPEQTLYGVFIDSAAVWNPSTQGAVDYVTMSIDKKAIDAFGQGQGIRIALLQDDQIFGDYFGTTGVPSGWTSGSQSNVAVNRTYDKFDAIDAAGIITYTAHPDFSVSGSAIKFGFLVAQTGHLPISGTTLGYDNWNLSLITSPPPPPSQVPEPSTLALFGLGLAGLCVARLRKATQSRNLPDPTVEIMI